MNSIERTFGSALARNTCEWISIVNDKHLNVTVFRYKAYYVVCNDDLIDEFNEFVKNNYKYVNEIFPSEFKCFKLDEATTSRLVLITIRSDENYDCSYSNRFMVISDKLYLVKMFQCNNQDGMGFAMMKCDLIKDDASLGSLMYINQNTNFLLKKTGGISGDKYEVLRSDGIGKAGPIEFSITLYGMLDLIASDAYLKNNPNDLDDTVYVEADSYKLPNFDSIYSVKTWIGDDENENNCPFISLASIVLQSKHLKLRKWLSKLRKTHITFTYRAIQKNNKAIYEF